MQSCLFWFIREYTEIVVTFETWKPALVQTLHHCGRWGCSPQNILNYVEKLYPSAAMCSSVSMQVLWAVSGCKSWPDLLWLIYSTYCWQVLIQPLFRNTERSPQRYIGYFVDVENLSLTKLQLALLLLLIKLFLTTCSKTNFVYYQNELHAFALKLLG